MAYDPLRALRLLQRRHVRFVVIGGVAARLWGSPTMTNVTEICCRREPENLDRLAGALRELGARWRDVRDDVSLRLEGATLAAGENCRFDTDAGPLDVLGEPAGIGGGFDELRANATDFDLGKGIVVPVGDLEDLIRMKRAAGRPTDRVELEVLIAVREERDSAWRQESTAAVRERDDQAGTAGDRL